MKSQTSQRNANDCRRPAPDLPDLGDLRVEVDGAVPSVLTGRLRTRVLLLGPASRWPRRWLSGDALQPAPGISLSFELIEGRDSGAGRLERLEDSMLWLAASDPEADELAALVVEAGSGVASVRLDDGRVSLHAGLPVPTSTAAAPGLDWPAAPVLAVNELLGVLAPAQRVPARIALFCAMAAAAGEAAESGDRHAALRAGIALYVRLSELCGRDQAMALVGNLLAMVRARNTLDNRLRNMANDRLGMLLLQALARLSGRARAFTVRELARELGAVVTGT